MDRSSRRIRLGSHSRIIADERTHFRGRRDKMDRDAPAHTVAAYGDAIFIDVRLSQQKAPSFGEHSGEFRVRRFGLNLRSADDVSRFWIAQLLEYVDRERGVTEACEFPRLRFDVLA